MSTERTSDGLLRIVLVVLAFVVLLPMVMMVLAVPMMGWGMMGEWSGGHMAGGAAPLWGIGMVLLWVVVLAGVGYLLYRGAVGRPGRVGGTDPALEELRLAYARGDLTDEEFEQRRETLRHEE